MAAKPRRMTKRAVGSVTCSGEQLTVIDAAAIAPRRVEVHCPCNRRHVVDVTPAVRIAIDEAVRGVLDLPAGDYRVVVNIGHSGAVLSAQLLLD